MMFSERVRDQNLTRTQNITGQFQVSTKTFFHVDMHFWYGNGLWQPELQQHTKHVLHVFLLRMLCS